MKSKKIFITKYDYSRLMNVIQKSISADKFDTNVKDLLEEIKRAKKIDPHDIPPDFVTMNSIFELKNLGKPDFRQLKLVFPSDADMDDNKISVLGPVGTAVLGYRVGDVIKWKTPSGEKYFQISKIIYQPEANGDFHL
jgi:regulator of nucleoside diphosphate kinase